ncbi:hypothetical protein, partial [Ensifer sp. Root142]
GSPLGDRRKRVERRRIPGKLRKKQTGALNRFHRKHPPDDMATGRAGRFSQRQEEADESFIFAAAEAPETLQAPKLADFLYGATGWDENFGRRPPAFTGAEMPIRKLTAVRLTGTTRHQ